MRALVYQLLFGTIDLELFRVCSLLLLTLHRGHLSMSRITNDRLVTFNKCVSQYFLVFLFLFINIHRNSCGNSLNISPNCLPPKYNHIKTSTIYFHKTMGTKQRGPVSSVNILSKQLSRAPHKTPFCNLLLVLFHSYHLSWKSCLNTQCVLKQLTFVNFITIPIRPRHHKCRF